MTIVVAKRNPHLDAVLATEFAQPFATQCNANGLAHRLGGHAVAGGTILVDANLHFALAGGKVCREIIMSSICPKA